ncbi:hypothetical protein Q9L58_006932 [Maublancomyces gigas]|uniref:Uncharacterized protein n=1 Tax=Discina gigas TaxID=1032678 RepID=A0ABR3GDZ4_9PEZI
MSDRDRVPAPAGIGDRIISHGSSRPPVAPRNLPVPVLGLARPRSFPGYSNAVPVSVDPGTVSRLPVRDPWHIWDATSRAPNRDKRSLEVIVTDTDAEGWANISIGTRRWQVPTGPGYPEDPSKPPNEYRAPQPPPRAVGQNERAFSIRPAHWEFVLEDNEYHPVIVPAALSPIRSFRDHTVAPKQLMLTPEQRAARPRMGTVGPEYQFPGVDESAFPPGGVPPWSASGFPENWILDPLDYTVPTQPSPWMADRHGGVAVHRQLPDCFPVPGSYIVTRVRPKPGSVDPFDQINVRVRPVATTPVGASVRPEEPERNPIVEDVPPEPDGLFFPDWIDNSLFREEKRISAKKPKLSSAGGSGSGSMPPPNETSGFRQQPPCRFPSLQAQNVGPAPQGQQPAPSPRYYVTHGSHGPRLYIDRFAPPPRPMSEMSERSLHSEVSERDLDEEEALWRRKVASGQAD